MSQIVTRKGPVGEDKDKRQTDSPVKEMKKKLAANAEKEKQAAEKNAEKSVLNEKKTEKSTEKPTEKTAEKKDKLDKSLDKSIEKKDKPDKSLDKSIEKKDKPDKSLDKSMEKKDKPDKSLDKSMEKKDKPDKILDKSIDKKDKAEKTLDKSIDKTDKKETISENKDTTEKSTDKKDKTGDKKDKPTENQIEKATEAEKDKEKGGKVESPEEKSKKSEPARAKENGAKVNGEQNGDTVSSDDELHESDAEKDEMFPELAYEDSDGECFEPPTPEGPSRSYTRRSQVKATRTPETPRPASEKNMDKDYVPDDSKLLKLKDDTPSSDRKLRSSDSPKRQDKKIDKVQESKKTESPKKDSLKPVQEEPSKPDDENETEKSEVQIEVTEVDSEDDDKDLTEPRWRVKADTNYSKSRVKVSPYRRGRLDRTDTSMLANYTGNNTTMEMDITEPSLLFEEAPESPYLSGLRSIRARRSYRPLKEMTLRNIYVNRSATSAGAPVTEQPPRPTGTVVGRKRRPEAEEAAEAREAGDAERPAGKRARLLARLARPFRLAAPLPARRNAEIVGINTDLPLTAPVASTETFDPEAIKAAAPEALGPAPALTVTPATPTDRDAKRCLIM